MSDEMPYYCAGVQVRPEFPNATEQETVMYNAGIDRGRAEALALLKNLPYNERHFAEAAQQIRAVFEKGAVDVE